MTAAAKKSSTSTSPNEKSPQQQEKGQKLFPDLIMDARSLNGKASADDSFYFSHFNNKRRPGNDTTSYILGVDEAGRGPVLGPLVYGVFFYPDTLTDKILTSKVELCDSKAINDEKRKSICERLLELSPSCEIEIGDDEIDDFKSIGWYGRAISPREISAAMLKRQKYNLNSLSHDTVIDLVMQVHREFGIHISHMYVDALGPPEKYQQKLESLLVSNGIVDKITVETKADAKYPSVGGASIVAKVARDTILENWWKDNTGSGCGINVNEDGAASVSDDAVFGSGYPGDPVTKSWLRNNLHPVFGFPSLIRFSWSTCETLLQQMALPVAWINDTADDENDADQKGHLKRKKNPVKAKNDTNINSFFQPVGSAAPSPFNFNDPAFSFFVRS